MGWPRPDRTSLDIAYDRALVKAPYKHSIFPNIEEAMGEDMTTTDLGRLVVGLAKRKEMFGKWGIEKDIKASTGEVNSVVRGKKPAFYSNGQPRPITKLIALALGNKDPYVLFSRNVEQKKDVILYPACG